MVSPSATVNQATMEMGKSALILTNARLVQTIAITMPTVSTPSDHISANVDVGTRAMANKYVLSATSVY